MEPNRKIQIIKDRDLNLFFSESFQFIRQNFKSITLSFLFIGGPVILLLSLLNSLNVIKTFEMVNQGDFEFSGFIGMNLLIYGLTIFIGILLSCVSMAIFKVYELYGPGNFTVLQIWKESRIMLLPAFGIFLMTLLMIIIPFAIIFGLVALLTSVGPLALVILSLLIFIGGLLALPLLYFFFGIYPARLLEGFSIGDAIARAWNLMAFKYWYTWVIVLLIMLISIVFTFAVTLPFTLLMQVSMMTGLNDATFSINQPLVIILNLIVSFCTYLIYPFMYILFTFHHFSLVEKMEGTGTLQQLNELGKPEDETNS